MLKKLAVSVMVGLMYFNLCGFALLAAGVSEASKAKETIDVSYSKAVDMVKAAMISQGIELGQAVIKPGVTKVRGAYPDGKSVRITINKISNTRCYIEVRVGTSEAGKEDARQVMQAIILESFERSGK